VLIGSDPSCTFVLEKGFSVGFSLLGLQPRLEEGLPFEKNVRRAGFKEKGHLD
jgi:hypothetical protein